MGLDTTRDISQEIGAITKRRTQVEHWTDHVINLFYLNAC